MIRRIQEYMLMKAKTIESQSDLNGYVPDKETYKYRYTFSRDMYEYFKKLPYLQENLKAGQTVLDIGAGNGSAISGIKESYQCNITASGVEIPSDALCPFTVAVASNLPFVDNSFDIVISVHGVSWEPDQKKAFEEILRVLKPGGTAHIYLITFRHSIALWFGNHFWDDVGVNQDVCSMYEFDPLEWENIPNAKVKIIENPDECDGHRYAWYVYYKKN